MKKVSWRGRREKRWEERKGWQNEEREERGKEKKCDRRLRVIRLVRKSDQMTKSAGDENVPIRLHGYIIHTVPQKTGRNLRI